MLRNFIGFVALFSLFGGGYWLGTTADPGCYEDEVLAVQIDTDPTHGLTWQCENVEEFIERTLAR